MANGGIDWRLAANNGTFLQQLTSGLDSYNKQQNLLQQIAGQEQDRQFRQQTDARNFDRQTSQDAITQRNWEQQFSQNAQNQNQMRAIQQAQLKIAQDQFARGAIPQGFERDPNNPNALRPIPGGDKSPEYVRSITDAKPKKPVPFGLQNLEKEDLEAINTVNTINSQLSDAIGKIDSNKLYLNPTSNLVSRGRNFLGASNEQSANFSSFQSMLEKMRNDSLRLNKGVQTEGDAQRVWNELVSNINDPKVVKQRLQEIIALNNRAEAFRKNLIVQRREDNTLPPIDFNRVLNTSGVPQQQTQQQPQQMQQPRTAVNPQTGERLQLKDGQWVPIQ